MWVALEFDSLKMVVSFNSDSRENILMIKQNIVRNFNPEPGGW